MLTTNKVKTPRSFRIVGPQRQIDERETPHPKVDRGEFGARLRDWRKNRVGGDPSDDSSAAAAKEIRTIPCKKS